MLKKLVLVFGVSFFIGLAGCTGGIEALFENEMNKIYDDEEELLDDGNSYNINKDEAIILENEYTRYLEIEGIQTIWSCTVDKEKEAKLEYKFNVESGLAKIIFINSKDEITTISEIDADGEGFITSDVVLKLTKGENRIRIVGKNKANIELEAKIEDGTWSNGSL